jgi:hypothetical protein
MPQYIYVLVLSQIETVTDVRLLRGSIPWSLAGYGGPSRSNRVSERDRLLQRVNFHLADRGWTAELMITNDRGKHGLVLTSPKGEQHNWQWPEMEG